MRPGNGFRAQNGHQMCPPGLWPRPQVPAWASIADNNATHHIETPFPQKIGGVCLMHWTLRLLRKTPDVLEDTWLRSIIAPSSTAQDSWNPQPDALLSYINFSYRDFPIWCLVHASDHPLPYAPRLAKLSRLRARGVSPNCAFFLHRQLDASLVVVDNSFS
jgi:hypothetical protein